MHVTYAICAVLLIIFGSLNRHFTFCFQFAAHMCIKHIYINMIKYLTNLKRSMDGILHFSVAKKCLFGLKC